jgi:hypothetical protein
LIFVLFYLMFRAFTNIELMRFLLTTSLLFMIYMASLCQTTSINYTISNDDFINPDRGWYRYSDTYTSNYSLLDSATIAGYRVLHTPQGGSPNYSVYASLVFRYFIFDNFKNAPLTPAILNNIQADFNTARKAGVKLITRFTYTVTPSTGSCGSWICPPYGDAPKNIVLTHIAQLKPILQQNKDVINSVQMGFIGTWGENYYTDYFGDASQPPYGLSSTNWNDRIDVLNALLDAVPSPINVQVRYPQMKQKALLGPTAPATTPAMALSEAFQSTNKSRIGFHNDCYLASADDFGTYTNYDNSSSDTLRYRPYKAADSKFVMVGGETCAPSSYDMCNNAVYDMARNHYSYLHADYNNAVNNQWTTEGCMEEIKRKLGYRISLKSATFPNSVAANQNLNFTIQLENSGFSSPINERKVYLILANGADEYQVLLPDDPRYWFTGNHTINGSVCIPSCVPTGNYSLHLHLADPSPALKSRPEYSIRTANTGTWNPAKGYNNLLHTVAIAGSRPACTGSAEFSRVASNKWNGANVAMWNTSTANWSINRIPDACDDVVIPANKTITVPAGYTGYAHSLTVQPSGILKITNTGKIIVEK